MAAKRPPHTEEPLAFDEAYAELSHTMRHLHISRIAEMPRIELYLDQLLSLVDMELALVYAPGEKIITGSMVNNYVKQRLLPPPQHKRYTRRHLASLVFVCAFKRVLSISQVIQLREMVSAAQVDVERAYDEVIGLVEQALAARFPPAPHEAPSLPELHAHLYDEEGRAIEGELNHLLEAAVELVATKVYLDRMLALEAQRP